MQKEDISIIIVDDLLFSRQMYKSGLKKSGFEDIRTAESGEEALLLLNQRRANVVLADFWMPNLNGLELTDLIRQWDSSNDRYTGVVLLTAEDSAASVATAFDRGVDDFVSKSADQSEVAARMYGAARAAHMQNELRDKTQEITQKFQIFQRNSLIDHETGLENKLYLLNQLEAIIQQCSTRGGGFALGVIKVTDENKQDIQLREGTLRTIANSMKLAMRPLDITCRLDSNTFAILIHLEQIHKINHDLFARLINNIKKRTREKDDTGQTLCFLNNFFITDSFDPSKSAESSLNEVMQNLTLEYEVTS